MDKNLSRKAATGAIVGAFLLPIALIGLWLGISYVQHATASQMSQWPLGLIVTYTLGAPLGAVIGASVVLIRQNHRRQAGTILAISGMYIAGITVLGPLRALISALMLGQHIHGSWIVVTWGAALTAPFLIAGTWLLRTAQKPK